MRKAVVIAFALIWLTMRDVWAILWDYYSRRKKELKRHLNQ